MRFPSSPVSPLVLLSSAVLLSSGTSALAPPALVAADACVTLGGDLTTQLGILAPLALSLNLNLDLHICLCLDLTAINAQLDSTSATYRLQLTEVA
jgi:hypothetical protein